MYISVRPVILKVRVIKNIWEVAEKLMTDIFLRIPFVGGSLKILYAKGRSKVSETVG